MAFGADVRRFAVKTAQSLDKTVADIETQVISLVIIRSPVDTGRFRGNWQVTRGAPAQGVIERYGAQASIQEMESIVRAMQGGRVTFVSNNLPYAARLEYDGWSQQAPEGMVRRTVAEFEQLAAAAGRKNRI